MIMPVSHSLSLRLARLLNLFGVMPSGEESGGAMQAPAVPGDAKAAAGAELTRARGLMKRLESVGVRFPAEVYEALEQAEAALSHDHWTLQVDRSFYSVLGLLESVVMRHGGAEKAARLGCYPGASSVADESGERRWTVIISNRMKVVEGKW